MKHFRFVFCTAEDKVCIELACTYSIYISPYVFTIEISVMSIYTFENISEIFGLSVFLKCRISFSFFIRLLED